MADRLNSKKQNVKIQHQDKPNKEDMNKLKNEQVNESNVKGVPCIDDLKYSVFSNVINIAVSLTSCKGTGLQGFPLVVAPRSTVV